MTKTCRVSMTVPVNDQVCGAEKVRPCPKREKIMAMSEMKGIVGFPVDGQARPAHPHWIS